MSVLDTLKKAKEILSPAPTSPKEVKPARKAAYDFVKEQGKKPKENEKK